MVVRLALLLRGFDMRKADDRARIPEDLFDLAFEASESLTYVVVPTSAADAPHRAAEVAGRVRQALPGVQVLGVHDELVALGDVADRCGVSHETARLWAGGKRRAAANVFPSPRQVVGAQRGKNGTKLYLWREVVAWVRDVVGLDPDEGVEFLSDGELAEVNARVASVGSSAVRLVSRRRVTRSVSRTHVSVRAEGWLQEVDVVLDECAVDPRRPLTGAR